MHNQINIHSLDDLIKPTPEPAPTLIHVPASRCTLNNMFMFFLGSLCDLCGLDQRTSHTNTHTRPAPGKAGMVLAFQQLCEPWWVNQGLQLLARCFSIYLWVMRVMAPRASFTLVG